MFGGPIGFIGPPSSTRLEKAIPKRSRSPRRNMRKSGLVCSAWREVPQKRPTVLGDGEQYIELIREFEGAADPLTPDSDSRILLRVEGYWDQPTALEKCF